MSTTETTIEQKQSEVKPIDWGKGSYSGLMSECHRDAMRVFKLASDQAEVLARAIATELGAIRALGKTTVTFGKLSKDGKVTMRDVGVIKGVTMTNTLMAFKALLYANEAGKNGFSAGRTQWAVMPDSELENYLLNL